MHFFLRILFIILVVTVPSLAQAFELRIMLTKATFPAVYFTDEEVIIEDGSENLYKITNKHNLQLSMSGNKLFFEGNSFPLPVTLYNNENRFFINGKGYRGKLEVKEINGKYVFINLINLEEYLRGVVSKEMPASWPLEALKAQAVIARTYAIYKATKTNRVGFDLYDSTMDQVYYGLEGESSSGDMAVTYTKDIVILHDNEIIKSYYHSTSGGRTEEPINVWGDDYPYLESTICGYDRQSPSYTWEYKVSRKKMNELLRKSGYAAKTLQRMRPLKYTSSGRNRIISLVYKDRTKAEILGVDLRTLVGNVKVKSTKFQILNRRDSFIFRGKGSGHGVGLCQWGARGMADKGFTFEAILNKYYRDISLSKLSFLNDINDDFIGSTIQDEFDKDLTEDAVTTEDPFYTKDTNKTFTTEEPHVHEDDNLGIFLNDIDNVNPQDNNRIPLDKVVR